MPAFGLGDSGLGLGARRDSLGWRVELKDGDAQIAARIASSEPARFERLLVAIPSPERRAPARLHPVPVAGFGWRAGEIGRRVHGDRVRRARADALDDGREVVVADDLLAIGERDDGPVDPIELVALDASMPSCSQRRCTAWRPECLPSTSVACGTPTSSGRMIS